MPFLFSAFRFLLLSRYMQVQSFKITFISFCGRILQSPVDTKKSVV